MSDVVDLAAFRTTRQQHLSGACRCLACQHTWEGVAEVGATWLECPACTLPRGRFITEAVYEGEHWVCKCGNDLFYVMPERVYCPNCGAEQNGL